MLDAEAPIEEITGTDSHDSATLSPRLAGLSRRGVSLWYFLSQGRA
jgi:hypothetical protein